MINMMFVTCFPSCECMNGASDGVHNEASIPDCLASVQSGRADLPSSRFVVAADTAVYDSSVQLMLAVAHEEEQPHSSHSELRRMTVLLIDVDRFEHDRVNRSVVLVSLDGPDLLDDVHSIRNPAKNSVLVVEIWRRRKRDKKL